MTEIIIIKFNYYINIICSYALASYYAQNYAGKRIIRQSLVCCYSAVFVEKGALKKTSLPRFQSAVAETPQNRPILISRSAVATPYIGIEQV